MNLARDGHLAPHPAIEKLAAEKAVGHADAEHLLRGHARTNPDAAKAVAEIDAARAAKTARVKAENDDCAERLGLSMDAVADLVGKLTDDPALETWLQSRINWTRAHERPLGHDE